MRKDDDGCGCRIEVLISGGFEDVEDFAACARAICVEIPILGLGPGLEADA